MSEHITHVAVYEDAVRLAFHGNILSGIAERSLRDHYDTGLLAAASRGNYRFAIPFIEQVLERRRRGEKYNDSIGRLLAASLGWLTHRAADDVLDDDQVPLLEALRTEQGLDEDEFHIDEHQVYQDAILFDKVYDGGRLRPRSRHHPLSSATLESDMQSHPGTAYVDIDRVELLFGALWQRRLLELHRFANSEENVDAWIDLALQRRQYYGENLELYADAFHRPDPAKIRFYIEDLNFYDESDPVIEMARALQRDAAMPQIDVEQAVQAGMEQSVYARGISKAYRNLQMASRFMQGMVARRELFEHLGQMQWAY